MREEIITIHYSSYYTYPLGFPVSLSVIIRAWTQPGNAPLKESLSVLYDNPMQIKVDVGVLFPRPLEARPRPPPIGEHLGSDLFILTALPSISDPSSSTAFCPSSRLPKST